MPKNNIYDLIVVDKSSGEKRQSFNNEDDAVSSAVQLSQKPDIKTIKIVERFLGSTDSKKERIIFEKNFSFDSKEYLVPSNADITRICTSVSDLFKKDSRLSLSSIFKKYLDDYKVSIIEILFSKARLSQLLTYETLIEQGMEDISFLYGTQNNIPADKVKVKLQTIVESLPKAQESFKKFDDLYIKLQAIGLCETIKEIKESFNEASKDYAIYTTLANYISFTNTWSGKVKLLLDLVTPEVSYDSIRYIDEILAEIFEIDGACFDVVSKKDDLGAYLLALINLYKGTYVPQEKDTPLLADLNALIASKDPVLLRNILLKKINQIIRNSESLSDDEHVSEMDFLSLAIKDMICLDRIIGKEMIADSLTMRVSNLGHLVGEKLENAIKTIMSLLPNDITRIFYLLDLTETEIYEKCPSFIEDNINKIAKKWQVIEDMFSEEITKINAVRALMSLNSYLPVSKVPNKMRQTLTFQFDKLLNGKSVRKPDDSAEIGNKEAIKDKAVNKQRASSFKRRIFEDKEIIFNEGEIGIEAYLIVYGKVEIFKKKKRIAILQRGEIFGEMAIIDDQPRMASARAVGKTEITIIPDIEFKNRLLKLEKSDPVIRRLIDVLVERIRNAQPSAPK